MKKLLFFIPLLTLLFSLPSDALASTPMVAAGDGYTVALKTDGTVWGWGYNCYGQLGDGTTTSSSTPIQVSDLTDVQAIAVGVRHTVTLKGDGTVWAWGYNSSGQLGDGMITGSLSPVQVSGMAGVQAIAAGGNHTVALKDDGTVWGWGSNYSKQLGETTLTNSTTPVQINNSGLLRGVQAIAAGGAYTVALKDDGTVWGWGAGRPRPAQIGGLMGIRAVSVSSVHTVVALKEDGTVWEWEHNFHSQPSVQVSDLTGIQAIAAGAGHTVALKEDGTVWAWGQNYYGQLGNGTTTINFGGYVGTPIQVVGMLGVHAIAAGKYHTIALKEDGMVWAWGQNYYGQLGGRDTTASSSIPVYSFGMVKVQAIAVGYDHTAVLKEDGTVWAWGLNYYGQLGNGTTTSYLTGVAAPIRASGLTGVKTIAAGSEHTVALKEDGTVWAWGHGAYGQLGIGTGWLAKVPVQVSGLTAIKAITAGKNHTVALREDGTVWAWGHNASGQLGNGTTTDSRVPIQVSELIGIQTIVAGGLHTLALKEDGTLWVWGCNVSGQLGNGTTTDSRVPIQVSGLAGVRAIAAGFRHTVALKEDGSVWAWGWNAWGQLGNGTSTSSATPLQVSDLTGVQSIAAGVMHTVVLKVDGTMWAWGDNRDGQLGDGTTTTYDTGVRTPVQVIGLTGGVQAIAAGDKHTVALKDDGTVWTWGDNQYGQLGDATDTNSPILVQSSGLIAVRDIAAGSGYAIALTEDGTVWAWGRNYYGQLGDGTTTYRAAPVQVIGMTQVQAIVTGSNDTFALKEDGTVWAWGLNHGQLGDGTTTSWGVGGTAPVQVSGVTGVQAIAVSSRGHTVALKEDGTVWAWGSNTYGQLGDGTTTDSLTPVQVNIITGVRAIAAVGYRTIALKEDGTIWAWGDNRRGQLGDGTTTNGSTPTPVQASGLTGVKTIAAGSTYTVVLKEDGTVWAWGDNTYGQLGDGTTTNSMAPLQVSGLTGIQAITAGLFHTVALKEDGTLWTWGGNWDGQLGDDSTTVRLAPVQVSGLTGIQAISAFECNTVALKEDGTVWAWGENEYGQLGVKVNLHPVQADTDSINNLTVIQTGYGSGTVQIEPAGISCGTDCYTYSYTSSVTLTADTQVSSTFSGWSGGDCSGTDPCTVSMEQAKIVTTHFAKKTYTLNGIAGSNGKIEPSENVIVDYGEQYTYVITPDFGYTIVDVLVDGASVGARTSYTFDNVTTDYTISASFAQNSLNVTKAGNGTGTVYSVPAGIYCGELCSNIFAYNSTVILSAIPDAGSTLDGWSGACTGTEPCVLFMNGPNNITASFSNESEAQPLTTQSSFPWIFLTPILEAAKSR